MDDAEQAGDAAAAVATSGDAAAPSAEFVDGGDAAPAAPSEDRRGTR